MCEMLWSDPQQGLGRSPSKRGVGVAFGADVTKNFLQRNSLSLLVRSHEVKEEGFEARPAVRAPRPPCLPADAAPPPPRSCTTAAA